MDKIAIMQPYFAPYIGYFQLMNCVDKFVVYDNIQFTKKGWINRNRLLLNGKDEIFTIPLLKDSDYADIKDRKLALDFLEVNKKTLRKIESSYKKAPFYHNVCEELNKCFLYDEEKNLFNFILNSLNIFKNYLKINTEIIISSTVDNENYNLKGKERVIHLCKELDANHYINPIGGTLLYDKTYFEENGILLNFIQSEYVDYKQFNNEFVPWLSIIDLMMFNSPEEINNMLKKYKLI